MWTTAPPSPNLRLTSFKVVYKGNSIADVTRKDFAGTPIHQQIDDYLERGQTYTIEGVIQNMQPPTHDTNPKSAPITLDESTTVDGKISSQELTTTSDNKTSIPAGGTASFSFDYTVPLTAQKTIDFGEIIPSKYAQNGDDYFPNDNWSSLSFKLAPEDIGVTSVQLVDQNNNPVTSPVANQLYKLIFTVDKPLGSTPIDNATLDVTYTDGVSTTYKNASATEQLTANGQVQVIVDNVYTSTGYLKATGTIDPMYQAEGMDSDLTNDTVSHVWQETINYSVQSLVVTPGSVALPYGQWSGSQTLTFTVMANLTVSDPKDTEPRSVPIVLSSNGRVLATQTISISPGHAMPVTFTIPSYGVQVGTIPFQVEINPNPGRQMESKSDGSDPYADNIAKTSLSVVQESLEYKCSQINRHNSWTTDYSITWWTDGHYVLINTQYGSEWVCERDYNWRQEDYGEYENFQIEHIYFKSHTTGDNWVDLMGSSYSSTPGLIKAGYGFQFEVVTNYNTNVNTAPYSWGGCSVGQWVYPYNPQTYVPNSITVKWPWSDAYNQPYVQMLYGSQSGDWYNMTTTYTLPYRDAFGISTVPEIFVNLNANDGVYPITVTTDPYFSGNEVKYSGYSYPSWFPNLCDSQTVYIKVTGSMYDDLRTHILEN